MKSLFLVSHENDTFKGYLRLKKSIQFVTLKLDWYTNQLLTANIDKYFPLTVGSQLKRKHCHEVAYSQKVIGVLQQYPIQRGLKTPQSTLGFNKRASRLFTSMIPTENFIVTTLWSEFT